MPRPFLDRAARSMEPLTPRELDKHIIRDAELWWLQRTGQFAKRSPFLICMRSGKWALTINYLSEKKATLNDLNAVREYVQNRNDIEGRN
jgi:hypothetical protein